MQAADAANAATKLPAPPASRPSPESLAEALDQQVSLMQKLADQAVGYAASRGPGVLATLVLFVVAWFISKWVRKLVISALTRAKVDLLLAKFFGNIARWIIVVFAFVTCLGTLGIETTSLAAIIGAAGLAVGLALQGNLGNLASGILLLIFRPFKIGDIVVVAGQAGVIDGIDLFTTNLDTADNRRIIIPNGQIFGGVIENQSHHPRRSLTINVPVSAAADLDEATRVLLDAAMRMIKQTPGALADPASTVTLAELAPTTIFSVTIWGETARFAGLRPALLREIKLAIDAAGLAPLPPMQVVKQVN